jgi:hypothetical protein
MPEDVGQTILNEELRFRLKEIEFLETKARFIFRPFWDRQLDRNAMTTRQDFLIWTARLNCSLSLIDFRLEKIILNTLFM